MTVHIRRPLYDRLPVDLPDLTDRLARLSVEYGANVQPGQVVCINAEYGHHEIVRALAAHAYERGARFVDPWYFDPHVKRARIAHAQEDTLEYVPPWYAQRALERGELRGALLGVVGATAPGLLDDLDPVRVGRDQLPRVRENFQVINDKTSNWLVLPGPTEAWARQVHPDAENALERLWEDIAHVCRLDADDPAAAWRERFAQTGAVAERLTGRRFNAVHFEGPGTDLTIGLLPTSRWQIANETTVDGIAFVPNLPSEEVTTTPDPERADGVVRSTRPLVLGDGTLIDGLTMRFEGGRAVELDAERGGEALRTRTAIDEGARRLGEVALVDREGRIGQLGTVFSNTLIDENASSHLALGSAYETMVGTEDVPRINRSALHLDFMIGSDEVAVTGITRDGERVPVLRGGSWQI
jgi:aminopeptidase